MSEEAFESFLKETHPLTDEWMMERGLSGMANLGNTCFLNSVIQCLVHTRPFLELFMSNRFRTYLNRNAEEVKLVSVFNQMCRALWYSPSTRFVIDPKEFYSRVLHIVREKGLTEFQPYRQADGQEFLQFLLERVHEALSREVRMHIKGTPVTALDKMAQNALESWIAFFRKEWSPLLKIFYGQFYTTIQTKKRDEKGVSVVTECNELYEPFNFLSLEIPTTYADPTIYDCLDHYCAKELLLSNGETKKTKQHRFWSLPPILIIFFKRWSMGGNRRLFIDKQRRLVEFPIDELDMTPYMCGYQRSSYQYQLYAIVNHEGGSNGGHYYSYVRHPITQQWYIFNDSSVKPIMETALITPQAYCLFYEKKPGQL